MDIVTKVGVVLENVKIVCLIAFLVCTDVNFCYYCAQLIPVKEIDGTTSQDIFTALNFGEES